MTNYRSLVWVFGIWSLDIVCYLGLGIYSIGGLCVKIWVSNQGEILFTLQFLLIGSQQFPLTVVGWVGAGMP
jgi:hypothetical protein